MHGDRYQPMFGSFLKKELFLLGPSRRRGWPSRGGEGLTFRIISVDNADKLLDRNQSRPAPMGSKKSIDSFIKGTKSDIFKSTKLDI